MRVTLRKFPKKHEEDIDIFNIYRYRYGVSDSLRPQGL